MAQFFKSISEVDSVMRGLSDKEKDLLRRISFQQCVPRNNVLDEGWVLMKDVGGSRRLSLKRDCEALVKIGLLERNPSHPVRYRIPDFTSGT